MALTNNNNFAQAGRWYQYVSTVISLIVACSLLSAGIVIIANDEPIEVKEKDGTVKDEDPKAVGGLLIGLAVLIACCAIMVMAIVKKYPAAAKASLGLAAFSTLTN